jgi:hypothetical protein
MVTDISEELVASIFSVDGEEKTALKMEIKSSKTSANNHQLTECHF